MKLIVSLVLMLVFSFVSQSIAEEYTAAQAESRINDGVTNQNLANGELQPTYYANKNAIADKVLLIQDLLQYDLPVDHPDRYIFESTLGGIEGLISQAEYNGTLGVQAFLYGTNALAYANNSYAGQNYNSAFLQAGDACYYYIGAYFYLRQANCLYVGGPNVYGIIEVSVANSINTQLDILNAQIQVACQ